MSLLRRHSDPISNIDGIGYEMRSGVAARRLTVVVLLTGYLAVSSGLVMAEHVQEAGPNHDPHSCPIHHQLAQTTKAELIEPAPISFDVQSVYLSPPSAADVPVLKCPRHQIAARAPPTF